MILRMTSITITDTDIERLTRLTDTNTKDPRITDVIRGIEHAFLRRTNHIDTLDDAEYTLTFSTDCVYLSVKAPVRILQRLEYTEINNMAIDLFDGAKRSESL